MKDRIRAFIDRREFEEARNVILQELDKMEGDADLHFYCGATYDAQGMEREAIPYYQKSLELGLSGEERQQAIINLGSSLRCVGEYRDAKGVLDEGAKQYPNNMAIQVFLAMVEYNLMDSKAAVEKMLNVILGTASDPWVAKYKEAIHFYSGNLDEKW